MRRMFEPTRSQLDELGEENIGRLRRAAIAMGLAYMRNGMLRDLSGDEALVGVLGAEAYEDIQDLGPTALKYLNGCIDEWEKAGRASTPEQVLAEDLARIQADVWGRG